MKRGDVKLSCLFVILPSKGAVVMIKKHSLP